MIFNSHLNGGELSAFGRKITICTILHHVSGENVFLAIEFQKKSFENDGDHVDLMLVFLVISNEITRETHR